MDLSQATGDSLKELGVPCSFACLVLSSYVQLRDIERDEAF